MACGSSWWTGWWKSSRNTGFVLRLCTLLSTIWTAFCPAQRTWKGASCSWLERLHCCSLRGFAKTERFLHPLTAPQISSHFTCHRIGNLRRSSLRSWTSSCTWQTAPTQVSSWSTWSTSFWKRWLSRWQPPLRTSSFTFSCQYIQFAPSQRASPWWATPVTQTSARLFMPTFSFMFTFIFYFDLMCFILPCL